MHARVSTYEVSADAHEQAIRGFEDQPIEDSDGFSAGYLLVDRESGKALSITMWESKEALERSAERANEMRSQVMQRASGQTADVTNYEVAVTKKPSGTA
jgi:heme-degrading monooxygenase HmoA